MKSILHFVVYINMDKSNNNQSRTKPQLITRALIPCACLLVLAACAHQKPKVYPNSAAQTRGPAVVDQDIAACEDLAQANGVDYNEGGDLTRRTAQGGVVGGAGGAAVGAIFGNVGRGAATGAAYGATTGFFSGLFSRDRAHPTYRAFVDRCLRDKGYDPIGWS